MAKNMATLLLDENCDVQINLLEAENVNVQTAHDGRLWVCVDGVNVLRVKRCKAFTTDLTADRSKRKGK